MRACVLHNDESYECKSRRQVMKHNSYKLSFIPRKAWPFSEPYTKNITVKSV